MDKSVLFLSNGHGEDEMAALLATRVGHRLRARNLSLSVLAYPLVGEGSAYHKAGLPVVGVQQAMPSGGFLLERRGNLLKDLRAGLLGLTACQWGSLAAQRNRATWTVAVGDIYVLALAAWIVRRPVIFIPTAKTEYIRGHYGFEYALMKRYARIVFPRDQATADAMQARGVPARFAGNLMMDALEVTGARFGVQAAGSVVALLPGSRRDAYQNARPLLEAASRITSFRPDTSFLLALAPSLSAKDLVEAVQKDGWAPDRSKDGSASPGGRVVARLSRGETTVIVVQGGFGDVLTLSDAVLGLSGTGNEQAAGMGKPVVAFPGPGSQFTKRFAEDQKRLLGEALCVVAPVPEEAAREVSNILNDKERYLRMARAGKERMGGPGAADRITDAIIGRLERKAPPAAPPYRRDE